MVHLDNLDKPPQLDIRLPVVSELARRRIKAELLEQARTKRRFKLLTALKREHWQAIFRALDESGSHYGCFGGYQPQLEYQPHPEFGCQCSLKDRTPICQACVIVTRLMEVLDD